MTTLLSYVEVSQIENLKSVGFQPYAREGGSSNSLKTSIGSSMKASSFFSLCVLFVALEHPASAQQPAANVPRVGYVATTAPDTPNNLAFRKGLRDLGYIEGKNILVEDRYAAGKAERIPSLVAELLQLKVDVVVSPVFEAVRAAKQSTKTIPIVMIIADDPVATGLIDSLAHPGANITGVTRLTQELNGKRLELLTEVLPSISRVVFFPSLALRF